MGINRDIQNVDEYWEEILQRNSDNRLSGLDGVDLSNSIQIEYTSAANRNAATNQNWRKGDQAYVPGDAVYFYVGANLERGAATIDSDWTSAGGGGDQFADQAALEAFITDDFGFRDSIGAGDALKGTDNQFSANQTISLDGLTRYALNNEGTGVGSIGVIDFNRNQSNKARILASDDSDGDGVLDLDTTIGTDLNQTGIKINADGVLLPRTAGATDGIVAISSAGLLSRIDDPTLQTQSGTGVLRDTNEISFDANELFYSHDTNGKATVGLPLTIPGNRVFQIAETNPDFSIQANDATVLLSMNATTADFSIANVTLSGVADGTAGVVGIGTDGVLSRVAGGGDAFDGILTDIDLLLRDSNASPDGESDETLEFQSLDSSDPQAYSSYATMGHFVRSNTADAEEGGLVMKSVFAGTLEDIIAVNTSAKNLDLQGGTIDPKGVLDIRTTQANLHVLLSDKGVFIEQNSDNKFGFYEDGASLVAPRQSTFLRAGNLALENLKESDDDDYRVTSIESGFLGNPGTNEDLIIFRGRLGTTLDNDGYLNGSVTSEIIMQKLGDHGGILMRAAPDYEGELTAADNAFYVKHNEVESFRDFIVTESFPQINLADETLTANAGNIGNIRFTAFTSATDTTKDSYANIQGIATTRAEGGEAGAIAIEVADSGNSGAITEVARFAEDEITHVVATDLQAAVTLSGVADNTAGVVGISATGVLSRVANSGGGSDVPDAPDRDLTDVEYILNVPADSLEAITWEVASAAGGSAFTTDVTVTKTDPRNALISNEAYVLGNEVGRIDFNGRNSADDATVTYASIFVDNTSLITIGDSSNTTMTPGLAQFKGNTEHIDAIDSNPASGYNASNIGFSSLESTTDGEEDYYIGASIWEFIKDRNTNDTELHFFAGDGNSADELLLNLGNTRAYFGDLDSEIQDRTGDLDANIRVAYPLNTNSFQTNDFYRYNDFSAIEDTYLNDRTPGDRNPLYIGLTQGRWNLKNDTSDATNVTNLVEVRHEYNQDTNNRWGSHIISTWTGDRDSATVEQYDTLKVEPGEVTVFGDADGNTEGDKIFIAKAQGTFFYTFAEVTGSGAYRTSDTSDNATAAYEGQTGGTTDTVARTYRRMEYNSEVLYRVEGEASDTWQAQIWRYTGTLTNIGDDQNTDINDNHQVMTPDKFYTI